MSQSHHRSCLLEDFSYTVPESSFASSDSVTCLILIVSISCLLYTSRLEQENPGCFDNPEATFADLYMKSGMYITEIVTRLYQSQRMKELYPDNAERLNHIFAKQVYGCAPTEIIYRICLRYILGFSDEIHICLLYTSRCV